MSKTVTIRRHVAESAWWVTWVRGRDQYAGRTYGNSESAARQAWIDDDVDLVHWVGYAPAGAGQGITTVERLS